MKVPRSGKQLKMDKSNTSVVVTVVVATIIVVFCGFSAKALFTQGAYQRRVVDAKHQTVKRLEDNITAAQSLSQQYDVFESANPNAIGGKSDVAENAAPPDGKNSRIVLDALPTQYDFPALISSLSKLVSLHPITNPNIGGSDQSSAFSNQPSVEPQPLTIQQIPISGTMSYAVLQDLFKDIERSIRPYDVTALQFSGSGSNMTVTLNMSTQYQPATIIELENKEVK
ncbi:hypothetical protein A3A68_00800 [Candidatus Saccharibacteria bacterium RIFCSPLOWO2_01_FULL_48_13]|nr:MAG: hypothetical protein A3F38_02815 [Candidatus Saccharibacteria bacterium RIFCSPHIGHO2_12_FULL_48_21]OGL36963.1 MAG: hypothetical protein A3A68_00800 [Candidatus Saccharibacteria bacterium RIFCSPLOWO2_01_FULL_48_13]